MNNYKKIFIGLTCIIILLITGIIFNFKNNKVNNNIDTTKIPIKEVAPHKKEDKKEIEKNTNDNRDLVPIEENNILEEEQEQPHTNQQIVSSTEVVDKNNYVNEVSEEKSNIVESQKEIIRRKTDSLGTAGRLYIPNININVGLYNANINSDSNYNAQDIVNNDDSAAYSYFSTKLIIADHDYQGFERLTNLTWQDNAYIKKSNNQVEEYQMINKFVGYNTGSDLIDLNKNSVKNMDGTLIIYTCYGNNNVMITLWNKLA